MPRKILISGVESLLGVHLAAYYLARSHHGIYCLTKGTIPPAEISSSISHLTEDIKSKEQSAAPTKLESRLVMCTLDSDHAGIKLDDRIAPIAPVSDVWFLPSGRSCDRHSRELDDVSLQELLAVLPRIGAESFNVVAGTCLGATADGELLLQNNRIAEHCASYGISYRIFSTGLVVGENPISSHTCRDGFLDFLGTLHEMKTEIEERVPQYFEFHALRCHLGAPDAELNIVSADNAVDAMLRIACDANAASGAYRIAAGHSIRVEDLFDSIGMAYDLSLLPVETREVMNAVDRDFDDRIASFRSSCEMAGTISASTLAQQVLLDELDEDGRHTLFNAVRVSQDRARAKWSQQCANILSTLEQKTISRNGFDLTYYASAAEGTPVICLNAIGQGLQYWHRLIDDLRRRHKVIIWEPRGTTSPPLRFGMQDQVEDLKAIIHYEGISVLHLVAWCTGPKVAVDFYLERPESVLSMAFLNSTFKCFGSSAELQTDYERNFEPLCRVLNDHPKMAASVMQSLQSGEEGEIDLLNETESSQDELARRVLATMNKDLRPHVRAPFQTVAATLNYAYQIHDFWSCDTSAKAGEVKVPVLLVSTEYDQVASPAMSDMAAKLFPRCSHVHVGGATHYCLYDRPHFIAGLLESSFDDARLLDAGHAGSEEVRYAS